MYAALYKTIIQVEKLVWLPVQAGACMRAAVFVGMKLTIFVYHEKVQRCPAGVNAKFFRAWVSNRADVAELMLHSLLY